MAKNKDKTEERELYDPKRMDVIFRAIRGQRTFQPFGGLKQVSEEIETLIVEEYNEIEPAVKEIRQKDGLKVTWKPIKKGRTVVALEFKFPVEPQFELFKIDKAFIDKNARPGESYEQAEKRLKEENKKPK